METLKPGEIISCAVLALFLLATIILCHDQKMGTDSIDAYIRVEVARQLKERPPPSRRCVKAYPEA